ncbi:MAG: uroporphyrinogen-III C-methyltransferase, partial [Verrucomicrobiae bacterium]|nr:uroporphyrinogen-III C-methyltransferase [Verrucomicrobiae bacterium]
MKRGVVYMVGAGPGASDLVTVRGRELIEACDVLVYDYLVYHELLNWTKPDCEKIYVGKRSGFHSKPQSDIEDLLIDFAKKGKTVVRLKGGDPFIFGRGGEEADALMDAGISFEIVPGVTACLGTAAYLGIPLTDRRDSSAVVLITGHEDPEKSESTVDWSNYARLDATLCIYMGLTRIEYICEQLTNAGMDSDTPVAVVRWATLPEQESCIGKL